MAQPSFVGRPRRSAIAVVVVLLGAAAVVPTLRAQAGQNKEAQEAAQMREQMEMMAPVWSRMSQGMMEGTLEVLAKRETAERLADFTRNFYEALLVKRFTKEEALRIVEAVGIPAMPSMR